MASEQVTVHDLDDDTLAAIFSCLHPEFRTSTIPLVCKAWQRVARRYPHQAVELDAFLGPRYTAPRLAWLLRDTSRLQEVTLHGCRHCGGAALDGYWEVVPVLMYHLSSRTPALRRLFLWPHPADLEHPPPVELLSLTCALSQLEVLSLRGWIWTDSDARAMAQFSKLRNLKALYLEDTRCCQGLEDSAKEDAAAKLQSSIAALQHLTQLILRDVDLAGMDGFRLRPPGNLTNLRALRYGSEVNGVHLPCLNQLTKLTRLEIMISRMARLSPNILSSLSQLKDLQLAGCSPFQQLTIPRAAKLTKLSFSGNLATRQLLWDVVPLEVLCSLQHLELKIAGSLYAEPDLLASLGQLTCMTHVTFNVGSSDHYLPMFLCELRGLRTVELTAEYMTFAQQGGEYLALLAGCLPRLCSLRVHLVQPVADLDTCMMQWSIGGEGGCEGDTHGAGDRMCIELCDRMTELDEKVEMQPISSGRGVCFNWPDRHFSLHE